MLPSALLQAGFAGVAASLWSVADVSTAMLMARFYDLWQSKGVEPVYALRQAQQWVRDTTNREKANYFAVHLAEGQPSGTTRMSAGVATDFLNKMWDFKDGPDARTFEHPFWWAAFTFTGV
jgi:CHAT domain-containing protein